MTASILEVGDLDLPCELARLAGGACDQFDVRKIDVLRSRIRHPREQPQRAQLVVS
jgi:hypothetical protein